MIFNSKATVLLFAVLANSGSVLSFSAGPAFSRSNTIIHSCESTSALSMSTDTDTPFFATATETEVDKDANNTNSNDSIVMPLSFDEMVQQASAAMTDAFANGVNRQMMRVLLPRDPNSGDLGMMYEEDADVDTQNLVLAPTDETWQGGIMQLYRAAAPTCVAILKKFAPTDGGIPPRMVEDRSVDESGVDGVGLWMSQNTYPKDDVSCFVQPTQEAIDSVESISSQAGERLVMLLNPQWRMVDDALDSASREGGVLGKVASFLGGKGNSLKRLEDLNFENVYTLEGYVCKGGNVRLLKVYGADWTVFAENDAMTDYIKVGTLETRPTYQDVDKMLDDKGIALKYARDIGLAPKFE